MEGTEGLCGEVETGRTGLRDLPFERDPGRNLRDQGE